MSPIELFSPAHRPPQEIGFPAVCCAFRAGRLLVQRAGAAPQLPRLHPGQLGVDLGESHYLGTLDGQHCFAFMLTEEQPLPEHGELMGMRDFILGADDISAAVAGLGLQIVEWSRTHRYCGSCGRPTVAHAADRARECPDCRQVYYPRISPVVMALVTRDRQLLLTRKPGYMAGRYTVVAGFVEPGETLEQALIREVREETGVEAAKPLYFGSQPWPFPNSLVMAFALEHAGGEARADGVELEDARWFDIDALPELPEPVHISRQLIDATIARLAGRTPGGA
ncbi:MAG TPA: NAD(+) diphosphatase [Burkholderiales bacterium]|nr:NAD(+) diphosphatase [Burkholderiales bacterium]